jgi:MFS family permease
MSYSQIAWLPLTGGLTLLGLIASWFAWKRRGVAAGLRGVAWSLLPVAAYLIGAIELLWRFGTAIGSFATSFVFSPKVWSGVAVIAVAIVLFVVSGKLRGRRAKKKKTAAAPEPGAVASNGARASGGVPARLPAGKRKAAADDDDMSDIQAILRRRGIN